MSFSVWSLGRSVVEHGGRERAGGRGKYAQRLALLSGTDRIAVEGLRGRC